jgi:hypothetical protein
MNPPGSLLLDKIFVVLFIIYGNGMVFKNDKKWKIIDKKLIIKQMKNTAREDILWIVYQLRCVLTMIWK